MFQRNLNTFCTFSFWLWVCVARSSSPPCPLPGPGRGRGGTGVPTEASGGALDADWALVLLRATGLCSVNMICVLVRPPQRPGQMSPNSYV